MTEAPAPFAPVLLRIVGPPAVGKMTVGHEIALRTGLRLFHNHVAIEPALRFFDFGTPPFARLVGGFRRAVIEEVAASELPGLILTFVQAFDDPRDAETLEGYAEPFRRRGGRVLLLELEASTPERLRRNESAFRLAEKPSKRDLAASRRRLLAADGRHRLNSAGEYADRPGYLRIDNTDRSPGEVADHVVRHFGLAARAPESGEGGTGPAPGGPR
ncbi:hypothetical protein AB0J21_26005 [Streptomyces sp. NPDC049954]|uniref:hypothetical protein n=1 Tax=Streptomyces sp. NPDC049954 TaxID=3155779 RepID=UPI003412345A